jgi:hypothetical protein
MSPLSREEHIELGVSIPSDTLVDWVNGQIAATKGRESRLQTRGVSGATLAAIRDLATLVETRRKELGEAQELPPQPVALAQRIREEAMGYWREAKLMANIEFATQPDVLAKFRTGVRTGMLLGALATEIESTIALLREHAARLSGLGGTDAFIARGEQLVGRLKDVKGNVDVACRALPPAVSQQCHDKGLLYDLTRKLVRVGRLEFMLDPEQAAHFNFTAIRRIRGVSTRPELKKAKVAGH